MKIIITGSHGQLGNELSTILKNGYSEIGNIDNQYKNCEIVAVDVDKLDITQSLDVFNFINKEKPDIVINCAAMTNVDGCETNLDVAMKINAMGPANLAKACKKVGAKLVHVSTDYVFPGNGKIPYREWDVCSPYSIYG